MLLSLSDEHKKRLGFFAKAEVEGIKGSGLNAVHLCLSQGMCVWIESPLSLVLREFLKLSVQFIKAGVNSKFYSVVSGIETLWLHFWYREFGSDPFSRLIILCLPWQLQRSLEWMWRVWPVQWRAWCSWWPSVLSKWWVPLSVCLSAYCQPHRTASQVRSSQTGQA